MHETARRLLQVGLAKGEKSFSAIAKLFDGSDQSATNWKTRGVPQRIIILAASRWRVDAAWLAGDPKAVEPECVADWKYPSSGPESEESGVAEERRAYALADDEQTVLDGYRIADDGLKRCMWLLATDALNRCGRRVGNHHQ